MNMIVEVATPLSGDCARTECLHSSSAWKTSGAPTCHAGHSRVKHVFNSSLQSNPFPYIFLENLSRISQEKELIHATANEAHRKEVMRERERVDLQNKKERKDGCLLEPVHHWPSQFQ
ncbi:hypothetical protein J6590_050282 [Homalodisca vitripennis]|nr:hypothetical protein J6590_050282 [Homalodisca vitripennis]